MPAALPRTALSPIPTLGTLPLSSWRGAAGARRRAPDRRRRGRPAAGWLLALLLLLAGAATPARAQTAPPPECSQDEKFANTWYFGYKAGLDFNQATDSIPPKVLTDGQMTAPFGSGVMSDGNGKILFYSNGDTIWNGNHTVMTNGTGLGGNRLTTDGPLPIRLPGSPPPGMAGAATRYLLFTQDAAGGPKGLSWSEIAIPAGGGAGTVVAATKNTPLTQGTTEKMTAVFHKNGCDIWVIVHGWGEEKLGTANRGDAFLAYRVRLVAGAGLGPVLIDAPVVSAVGSLHAPSVSPLGYRGQMKVTPDGQRLAVARYSEVLGDSSSTVELFNFDTSTGQVSANPQVPYIVDHGEGKYYGVDFSGGSKLYATVMNPPKLLQFDISGMGPVNKQSLPLRQATPVNLGSLQTAPDGKIYVARENQPALGFITYPDSVGAKARYADDSLTLRLSGRRSGLGLVNFNQSSLLRVGPSAEITGCRQITFTAPPIDFDNKIYSWKFGDGATSAEQNPVHVYATPGVYTVTLRISTDCFCRESSGSILVPDLPQPGNIAASQTLCGSTPPPTLTSTVNASGNAGLPLVYQWQTSTDNTTFTDISGATGASYTPPGNLPVGTTYFRRRALLLLPNQSGPYCTPSFTAAVAITVLPALGAGSIAASQTVCAGAPPAPLTSSAAATGGTGTVAYQWQSSPDNTTWANIAGATGDTYAPGALPATTYFRRQASSGPCGAFSNPVTLTVLPALAAGTIAASQTLCAGTTPSPLTSQAPASGGTNPISYQWESSGDNATWTAIAGATGAGYAPGTLAATTYFRRRASADGACAPAISNVVTITVAPALLAGTVGADQTICAGAAPSPLTDTQTASGGPGPLSYQWESSADNATWAAIAGATGAGYAPGALPATTYFRRRVSSGVCGPAYTPVVTITVLPALAAGSIAASQTICVGTTPSPLTSTAPATGNVSGISYQWEASADNTNWSAIGGATGATYAPGVLTITTYYRRQANAAGICAPAVSNVVLITVAPGLAAGTIGTDQTLCPGATPAPFTSMGGASGGSGVYAYQWESSPDNAAWVPIAGATGITYAPGPLTATTYYRRLVTSEPCGPANTNSVVVTVLPTLAAGSIGASQSICTGATPSPLTSSQGASGGTGTFTYQWESSLDNTNWRLAPGVATGDTYAPGALMATTYYRRRVASGPCSAPVSNVVTVTVQPIVTTGVSLAPPPVQCAGTPLTFTAVPTNAGAAPTFQWFVNNTAVASGPTFTSSTLVTGDQVRVQVTPTAGLCSTGPASATVTVTRTPIRQPTLSIALQPGAPQCPGEPLTFSVATATDAGPAPAYQWQVNGADVAGATGPLFTSTTLRDGQTVTVRLRTTDACGQPTAAVSGGIVVRQLPPVVVSAGPDKEILLGSAVVLEGTADGNYPVTWTPALGLTFPNGPLRPVVSPTVTTTYTISGGSGGCASSDQVTITVRPGIRIPNAFTPNGDGRDDTWQIEFIEQYPDNSVSVFNRWGNRIFSAENYSRANEWRGDINGQPAPVGTYYYVVTTRGPLGKSYSGSLTVLY